MRPTHSRQFPADAPLLHDNRAIVQNLAAQVSDIQRRIDRLQRNPEGEGTIPAPTIGAVSLRRMIMARRVRAQFFTEGLFADPAWDILLDLLVTQLDGQRVSVTNLCVASNVPATTALRWIKTLESDGLVTRRADPLDGRRFFVELTEKAEQALEGYFSTIDPDFVI